jgi:hypothetical protein
MIAELDIWRNMGATPIMSFMRGGMCTVPTFLELNSYGDFIVAATKRYGLSYIEVWNEPDFSVGLPSLYGCFGSNHVSRLKYLVKYVNLRLDKSYHVGVSFATSDDSGINMLKEIAPYADWVGFHHYAIWFNGQFQEAWPGSLELKLQMVQDIVPKNMPVWLTEVNLRSPSEECGPAHQQAQGNYLSDVMDLDIPVKSILVYHDYPNWQCTGMRNNPASDVLMWPYP